MVTPEAAITQEVAGRVGTAQPPRVIAFYLPQFHPVPENDAWWGGGFTEWTNVVGAQPRFAEHYQPHLPADLGFYDLRLPEVREQQARLAKAHGVAGFCYYHYWFKGRRLLSRPFDDVLASGSPDFPFMLCWANESWTRAWDGGTNEVLVAQEYDEEDDLEHIRWLITAFRDPRYITVNGRPVLMVYRPQALPDAPVTFALWRKECIAQGMAEPMFVKFDTRGDFTDPASLGCDAAAEFLPHGVVESVPRAATPADSHPGNLIFDYRAVAETFAAREPAEWKRYSCVFPGWDNSARRPDGTSLIVQGQDPDVYERWLTRSLQRSREDGRELVFVNAWNEWAEGAHLEPDQRFGRRFLEATRRAVESTGGVVDPPAPPSPPATPKSAEERYADLHERFVRLQQLQTDQFGAIRRHADREIAGMAADLDAARAEAASVTAWAGRLHADLQDAHRRFAGVAPTTVDQVFADAPDTRLRSRYIDLLKGCLTRMMFIEEEAAYIDHPGGSRDLRKLRAEGRDWPAAAETMIGAARLDNLQQCVERVLADDVPGDFLEAGVWRGGASIFMRALLEVHRDPHRQVWVADSFRGLPKPNLNLPQETTRDLSIYPELAVSLRTVQANFARYGLLDERVRFLEGWFKDTLPGAPIERLSVLRLDGDYYESTMDSLVALYPRLSVGGYVIIDDYVCIEASARATDDFRSAHGIDDEMFVVDWAGVFWRRSR